MNDSELDMMYDSKKTLDVAQSSARAAAAILLARFGTAEVHEKSSQNLVTQADFESEQEISRMILERFPDHRIMREEAESTGDASDEHLWVVDPLDATNNYAHGVPHFCVSIGYAHHGQLQVGVVLDPMRNELFTAVRGEGATLNGMPIHVSQPRDLTQCLIATGFYYERGALMERTLKSVGDLFRKNIRGIRRMGAAALDFSWVACGRMQGFFEYRLEPWDFAAGSLIVSEAGGLCTDCQGGPLTLRSRSAIAAGPSVAQALSDVVRLD